MNRTQLRADAVEALKKLGVEEYENFLVPFLLSQLNHALDEQEKAITLEGEEYNELTAGFDCAKYKLEALKAEFNK